VTSSDLLPLLTHMEWADAQTWRAVRSLPESVALDAMRERLLHLHLVQHAFVSMWTGAPLTSFPQPAEFPTLAALQDYARPVYGAARAAVAATDAAALATPLVVPHSEQLAPPGGSITHATVAETVLQVWSHTAHHRGQIAMQIRQLGGEPPLVDYVVWIWLGRPAPAW
jgi:uncharacterized damage-inducible protein DinB